MILPLYFEKLISSWWRNRENYWRRVVDLNQLKQDWFKRSRRPVSVRLPDSDYEKNRPDGLGFFGTHYLSISSCSKNGTGNDRLPLLLVDSCLTHCWSTLMDTLQQAKTFSALGLRRLIYVSQRKINSNIYQKNLPDIKRDVPALCQCASMHRLTKNKLSKSTPAKQLKTDLIGQWHWTGVYQRSGLANGQTQFGTAVGNNAVVETHQTLQINWARLIAEPLSDIMRLPNACLEIFL